MSLKKSIFFRADGNSEIGLGHLVRMLALVNMLKSKFECNFIIKKASVSIQEKIIAECDRLILLPDDCAEPEEEIIAKEYLSPDSIVVLDGYQFDSSYQKVLKDSRCKLVCIDDFQHTEYFADLVINHAPKLKESAFKKQHYTKLLLGERYALLRAPFLNVANKARDINKIKTIFICFGGADFNGLSLKILKNINEFSSADYEVNLVLGSANKATKEIKQFAKREASYTINIFENLDANQMLEVIQNSDCAIVPASGILYECLAVKLPIISGYYVDNQINIYNGFNAQKVLYGVGDLNQFSAFKTALESFTKPKIKEMLQRQENLGISNVSQNIMEAFEQL